MEQTDENEQRAETEREVEAFCERLELKPEEREGSLRFISNRIDEHESLATAIAYNRPLHVHIRLAVVQHLHNSAEEWDEMARELNRLSAQAREEKARILAKV
jgi:hypothetical protein